MGGALAGLPPFINLSRSPEARRPVFPKSCAISNKYRERHGRWKSGKELSVSFDAIEIEASVRSCRICAGLGDQSHTFFTLADESEVSRRKLSGRECHPEKRRTPAPVISYTAPSFSAAIDFHFWIARYIYRGSEIESIFSRSDWGLLVLSHHLLIDLEHSQH
jgi:hypothetical protein